MKQVLKNIFLALGLCIWVGIVIIAAQYIIAFPMIWLLGAEKVSQPVWTTVYTALTYLLSMALVIFLPIELTTFLKKRYPAKSKIRSETSNSISLREKLGLKGLPTFTDLGLAPIAFAVYLLLAAGVTALMSNFTWFNVAEAQNVGFSNLAPGLDRIVAFLSLVIFAPIAEEIIFRGWLYGHLRARLSLVPAILFTSILFGIMHGQWNVGVNVFAMSVILCAQREITGTVYSGILLHIIKNGVAFYLLYIVGMH